MYIYSKSNLYQGSGSNIAPWAMVHGTNIDLYRNTEFNDNYQHETVIKHGKIIQCLEKCTQEFV